MNMDYRCRHRTVVFCLLASTLFATNSFGFKPEYEAYGHTMISAGVLGDGYSFGKRPDNSLYQVGRLTYSLQSAPNDSRWVTFDARKEITIGVQSRDWGAADALLPGETNLSCVGAEYFGAPDAKVKEPIWVYGGYLPDRICVSKDLDEADGHFDNDNFAGSLQSIRLHTQLAITYASQAVVDPDPRSVAAGKLRTAARVMLGKALHTIQDFYAHSNWPESSQDESIFPAWTENLLDTNGAIPSSVAITLAKSVPVKAGQQVSGAGQVSGNTCAPRPYTTLDAIVNPWWSNDGNHAQVASAATTTSAWWIYLGSATNPLAVAAASDVNGDARCDHGVTDANSAGVDKFSGIAKDMPGWPLSLGPQGKVTGEGGPAVDDYHREGAFVTWPPGANDPKSRAAADATDIHLKASFLAAKHTRHYLEKVVEAV